MLHALGSAPLASAYIDGWQVQVLGSAATAWLHSIDLRQGIFCLHEDTATDDPTTAGMRMYPAPHMLLLLLLLCQGV